MDEEGITVMMSDGGHIVEKEKTVKKRESSHMVRKGSSMNKTMTFEELLERDGRLVYSNKGISMMPLLRQGRDLMIITRKGDQPCKKLDAVMYKRPDVKGRGAYVLHRILRINEDGSYWIVGDNCVFGETVKEENVLGIMTGFVRDGKTTYVDDPKYQLYVQTWCRHYRFRFFVLNCAKAVRYVGRAVRKLVQPKGSRGQ